MYRFLWPLRFGWLLVCCLYKEVYLQIFKCASFWLHGCCGEWEGWARKSVSRTSWVALVTPTDRPKSVCNRCVIELFCGGVCVVALPSWHFCWCSGFFHRTDSDLFLFSLSYSSDRHLHCTSQYTYNTPYHTIRERILLYIYERSRTQKKRKRSDSVIWQKPLHP